MVTVQQVFDTAIHLMDEQNESNGGTQTVDTDEYRFRTISILNTAIPALYPYSGTYSTEGTGRPFPGILAAGDYKNPDLPRSFPWTTRCALHCCPIFWRRSCSAGKMKIWRRGSYSDTGRHCKT